MAMESTKELLDRWSDEAWKEEMQTDLESWAEHEDNKVNWDAYFASQVNEVKA